MTSNFQTVPLPTNYPLRHFSLIYRVCKKYDKLFLLLMTQSVRRSLVAIFVYSSVLLFSTGIQAQGFEGEITMQMTSPMLGPQKIDILFSIKGAKVLQSADDPKQGKINIYTDTKAGTQIIVQEAQ